ncbi:MAG: hypothetical protein AAFR53_02520 [Pseudomonadota bacterium]
MRIHIEEVPLGARRRVAQLLETIRGTELDPTRGRASLTGEVNAIYRPDLKDVAYYEFVVDLGRGEGRRVAISGRGNGEERLPARHGFIIASSDRHDHPVSHWSLDREPPSHQIATAAKEGAGKIARIFKLDALAYAGESEGGAFMGQTGQMPMPIEGLPDDPEKMAGKISSSLVRPAEGSESDEAPGDDRETMTEGARRQVTKIGEVSGWEELREGYAEAFGPLLEGLKQSASASWEIEDLVGEYGEGIQTGTTHKVALLEPDASVEISGEGAELVELEPMETSEMGGCVAIHVADKRLSNELCFELDISYRSGLQEQLRFFVVSPGTPSSRKSDNSINMFEE